MTPPAPLRRTASPARPGRGLPPCREGVLDGDEQLPRRPAPLVGGRPVLHRVPGGLVGEPQGGGVEPERGGVVLVGGPVHAVPGGESTGDEVLAPRGGTHGVHEGGG